MPIADSLLPEFDQEMANTRKTLERCPEDKFSWKPHAKSLSMALLATHIAETVGWAQIILEKDSFDVAPPGAPPYKPEEAASLEQLLEKFDTNLAATRAALAATSDDQFTEPWSLLSGGKPLITLPRVAFFRSMIMNHLIHHRAQLSLYLRLNDVPVPALYGPSADEVPM